MDSMIVGVYGNVNDFIPSLITNAYNYHMVINITFTFETFTIRKI